MPRVVVLGGGYSGIRCIQRLSRLLGRDWQITLIDRNPYHQLLTRLPNVVSGRIERQLAEVPFKRVLSSRVHLLQAEVLQIDPGSRTVETSMGRLPADKVVISLGTKPDDLRIPGVTQHASLLKSVQNAADLRDRIERLAEDRELVRIAVIGAGYTGTEVAGDLAEWGHELARHGKRAGIYVRIVAPEPGLLSDANPAVGAVAERILASKGVALNLGNFVCEITPSSVRVAGRPDFPADLTIWAAHSTYSLSPSGTEFRSGQDQRLSVDPYLRVVGHEGVYAAGDAALTYDFEHDRVDPASAQLAVQEGEIVARNLIAEVEGRPLREFRPRILGEALSLGGRDGAAEIAGIIVTGAAAVAVKQAALARYLGALGGPRLLARYLR